MVVMSQKNDGNGAGSWSWWGSQGCKLCRLRWEGHSEVPQYLKDPFQLSWAQFETLWEVDPELAKVLDGVWPCRFYARLNLSEVL